MGYTPKNISEYYKELNELVDALKQTEGLTQDEVKELRRAIDVQTKEVVSLALSALMFKGRGANVQTGDGSADAFFSNIMQGVSVKVTTDVPAAMAVGVEKLGVTMFVNPYYLVAIAKDMFEVMAIIRHECYHLIFKHLTLYSSYIERGHIKRTLTNLATDCEINQIVTGLPEGTVTLELLEKITGETLEPRAGTLYYLEKLESSDFSKKLEEQRDNLMQKLKQQAQDRMSGKSDDEGDSDDTQGQTSSGDTTQNNNQSNTDSQEQGGGQGNNPIDMSDDVLKDALGGLSQEELEALFGSVDGHSPWGSKNQGDSESVVDSVLGDLLKGAYSKLNDKQRGHLPGNITEAIDMLTKERVVNWKTLVRKGFGSVPVPYKQTKKRMNRRQPHRPELSGRMTDRQVNVVVFIDTSGSMSDTEVAYSMGEIKTMVKDIKAKVDVVLIDTKVNKVYRQIKDPRDLEIVGRGGTLFQPAFDYLRQNKHTNRDTLAVYFTDGYGEPEDQITRYGFNNIYWVLTGDHAELDNLSCEGNGRVALLKDDAKLNKKKFAN